MAPDDQSWQPPDSSDAAPPQGGANAPEPTAGANQGYGPQQGYGAPQPGPSTAPGGWSPPPKPGLIPLRPLGFGTLMGAPFQVLRRNPKPTFGSALLIQAVVLLASILVVGVVTAIAVARIGMADSSDVGAVAAGSVAAIILAALVPMVLSLIGSAMLQGVIVSEVARGTVGEKLTMRQLWREITGRRGALIGWVLLIAAAVIVAFVILAGLVTVLVMLGTAGIVIGVLLGILGLFSFAALGVWLGTKLALVPSVIVLERTGIRTAVKRSWSLTHSFFWRTFGIIALIGIILSFASQIVTTPIAMIYGVAISLIDPTNAGEVNGSALVTTIASYLILILVSLVIGSITSIVQSAAAALIYIDLRMRKEGLDLTLVRFVEDAQAGSGERANPFLPRQNGAQAR